jgi:hypothetical protein
MTRFHFDLRHVADPAGLVAEVHGATFELVAQTSDTLTAEAAAHPVLAAMPAERTAIFSHYADIADDCLDGGSEAVRWVRVVRPAAPGVHLPEVILLAQYLPAHHLRAYARRAMARDRRPPTGSPADPRRQIASAPRLYAGKLAHLEVAGPPADAERLGELLVQAQTLVTPYDTAADLASHHPELATRPTPRPSSGTTTSGRTRRSTRTSTTRSRPSATRSGNRPASRGRRSLRARTTTASHSRPATRWTPSPRASSCTRTGYGRTCTAWPRP